MGLANIVIQRSGVYQKWISSNFLNHGFGHIGYLQRVLECPGSFFSKFAQ